VNWLAADDIIRAALNEDLGAGDITTELALPPGARARGCFVAKAAGVLCGAELAQHAFAILSAAEVSRASGSSGPPALAFSGWQADGTELASGQTVGRVECSAATLLGAERVALNMLQRLSGIATFARRLAVRAAPLGIHVCETRKTTPGLRVLEKYAVRTGGGFNHRIGLDSAILLKDNHFALSGKPPAEVVRDVRAHAGHTLRIISEATSPEMCAALAHAGTNVVLLDNFSPDAVRDALALVASPEMAVARTGLGLGRVVVEVSGGVSEANLDSYLIRGVDVISIGALTHSAPALDISLEAEAAGPPAEAR
jgi:nicotinate-nucleotide pyrophosphorylase (carboxylating)